MNRFLLSQILRLPGLGTNMVQASLAELLYRDRSVLVHVGKTGGGSVWRAIRNNGLSDQWVHAHAAPVFYRPKSRYVILVRDPIDRVVSSFKWRYLKVVDLGTKRDEYPGEYQTFLKYRNLNTLAEALYQDGQINKAVHRDYNMIRHLREDFSFMLGSFTKLLSESSNVTLISQATLNKSVHESLGIDLGTLHRHKSAQASCDTSLSEKAIENLKKRLAPDYKIIETLESHCRQEKTADPFARVKTKQEV